MSWAPATGPPTVAAVLMHPDRVAVALHGSPVTLSWTARQALMRRLQHVQETVRLRASFTVADAWPPVTLLPGQRTALLRVLEEWALDLDGYEPIPQELLEFRDVLIADSARQRSSAAPSRTLPPMPERLDFITVKLSTQEVTLGWETRRALLANLALGQQDVGRAIRRAFDARRQSPRHAGPRPEDVPARAARAMVARHGRWLRRHVRRALHAPQRAHRRPA